MNLQDITTWTITADHKARPKNIYEGYNNSLPYAELERIKLKEQWETFATQHTYACSPTLVAGDYPAEDVELVWQENLPSGWKRKLELLKDDIEYFKKLPHLYRQYLQLKQPVKEQEIKVGSIVYHGNYQAEVIHIDERTGQRYTIISYLYGSKSITIPFSELKEQETEHKQIKKMEKEIFFALSDNADLSNLYLANLDNVKEHILTDLADIHPNERDRVEYIIKPVFMTQDEFDNLPEYQF